jgi:protein-disulfide isomerase
VLGLSLAFLALMAGLATLALRKPGPRLIRIVGGGQVQQVFGGLQQAGNRLGPPAAPVTIQVFNDPQCTPCAAWDRKVTYPLVNGFVRPGDARMILHLFPMGQNSREISFPASAAAGKQGREWQYVSLLFRNQEQAKVRGVTEDLLRRIASAIPDFDVSAWQRARAASGIQAQLTEDDRLAANLGLPAKPAVIVNGPRGTRKLTDAPSLGDIQAAVSAVR